MLTNADDNYHVVFCLFVHTPFIKRHNNPHHSGEGKQTRIPHNTSSSAHLSALRGEVAEAAAHETAQVPSRVETIMLRR